MKATYASCPDARIDRRRLRPSPTQAQKATIWSATEAVWPAQPDGDAARPAALTMHVIFRMGSGATVSTARTRSRRGDPVAGRRLNPLRVPRAGRWPGELRLRLRARRACGDRCERRDRRLGSRSWAHAGGRPGYNAPGNAVRRHNRFDPQAISAPNARAQRTNCQQQQRHIVAPRRRRNDGTAQSPASAATHDVLHVLHGPLRSPQRPAGVRARIVRGRDRGRGEGRSRRAPPPSPARPAPRRRRQGRRGGELGGRGVPPQASDGPGSWRPRYQRSYAKATTDTARWSPRSVSIRPRAGPGVTRLFIADDWSNLESRRPS